MGALSSVSPELGPGSSMHVRVTSDMSLEVFEPQFPQVQPGDVDGTYLAEDLQTPSGHSELSECWLRAMVRAMVQSGVRHARAGPAG